jgi:molybdopterin converting factor small subunit
MMTTFQIPRILRRYCDGLDQFPLEGDTITEILHELRGQYPNLYSCICNEQGVLRPHINLFINNDYIRDRDNLASRLEPGDVVSVFQAVSGG